MILVTGFEGYGGRKDNPSASLVGALDGSCIDGVAVKGHLLPVDLAAVRQTIPDLIDDLKPEAVVSFGLWPGEPVVRLERVAINCADFELSDNLGMKAKEPVIENGANAFLSSLPIDEIERNVRNAGIPCRRSSSAGTFLCNATMYIALNALAHRKQTTPAGFIHLPYLPCQVAELLDAVARESILEQHQRSDYASMALETMAQAARIALATTMKVQST